jgi:hypothetical protein
MYLLLQIRPIIAIFYSVQEVIVIQTEMVKVYVPAGNFNTGSSQVQIASTISLLNQSFSKGPPRGYPLFLPKITRSWDWKGEDNRIAYG